MCFLLYLLLFKQIKNAHSYIFSFFIISLIVAYLTCLSVAIPKFFVENNYEYFFYQEFSKVISGAHHLSYFVLFGIVILISNLLGKTSLCFDEKKYLWLKILSIIVLSIFLFQLSSKATIILFVIISLIIFVYIVVEKILALKYALAIIAVAILFVTLGFSTKKVNLRFSNFVNVIFKSEEFNPKSIESTALRISALKTAKAVIKDNFWFGTGTGDLLYKMNDYYKENYFQAAYIKYVSPHNQFLRTFAMHGVFGFISLISVFVLMISTAVKQKSFLLWMWILMMLVLFNVEDMFGIQCGVVFFSFFTSLMLLNVDTNKLIT